MKATCVTWKPPLDAHMARNWFPGKFSRKLSDFRKTELFNRKFREFQKENHVKRKFWVRHRRKIFLGCLLFRKFWEILFQSSMKIFKPGTLAMWWKISIWTFENHHWRVQHEIRKFQEKRTVLRDSPKFLDFFFVPMAEWFSFRKFNNFRIFWKRALGISIPFVPVSKFLFERKANRK